MPVPTRSCSFAAGGLITYLVPGREVRQHLIRVTAVPVCICVGLTRTPLIDPDWI